MNEKESDQTVLVRRKDVEDLLEQFNEHAHSSWSTWLGTKIRELPTLIISRQAGGFMVADVDTKVVMVKTLHSINRSLDQLTANLRAQLEDGHTAKEQKTNGDWIRSMTDEEIGIVLSDSWPCNFNCDEGECDTFDGDCRACCLAFLKAKRGTTGRELNPDAEA